MGWLKGILIIIGILFLLYYVQSPEQKSGIKDKITGSVADMFPGEKIVGEKGILPDGTNVLWFGRPVKEYDCAIDLDCVSVCQNCSCSVDEGRCFQVL